MLNSRPLPYHDGPLPLQGHLAFGDATTAADRRPGALVVHEAFGLTAHAKDRADRVAAELGYVALAVDLYGKMPADRAEAFGLMGELREAPAKLRQRMRAGLSALRSVPQVDPNRIVAIGFCFGGTSVLELARDGGDVLAVVSFHGGLTTRAPAAPGAITAKVLSCTGHDDPHIPADTVRGFEAEMTAAQADWQVAIYGNAAHGFTNPGADKIGLPGVGYNAAADRRSWAAMRELFDEVLTTA